MGGGALAGAEPDEKIIDDHLAVQAIIRSYQVTNRVHCVLIANLSVNVDFVVSAFILIFPTLIRLWRCIGI